MTLDSYRIDWTRNIGAAVEIDSEGNKADGALSKWFRVFAPQGKQLLGFVLLLQNAVTNSATTNTNPSANTDALDLQVNQIYAADIADAASSPVPRSVVINRKSAEIVEQMTFNMQQRTYPVAAPAALPLSATTTYSYYQYVPFGGAAQGAVQVQYCLSTTTVFSTGTSSSGHSCTVSGVFGDDTDGVIFASSQSGSLSAGSPSVLDQQPPNFNPDLVSLFVAPGSSQNITRVTALTSARVVANGTLATLQANAVGILSVGTYSDQIVLAPMGERFTFFQLVTSGTETVLGAWVGVSGGSTNASTPPGGHKTGTAPPASQPKSTATQTGGIAAGRTQSRSGFAGAKSGGSRSSIVRRKG